jgi:hypothetical protein
MVGRRWMGRRQYLLRPLKTDSGVVGTGEEQLDPSMFFVERSRCWALVYDHKLQSMHCRESPSATADGTGPKHDGTRWRGWSCPEHIAGRTALRAFGRRQ